MAEDEELQQQYKHLIELAPNILVMFKEALLNPEDSDRKRVLHASIDLANQLKAKLHRASSREQPATVLPSSVEPTTSATALAAPSPATSAPAPAASTPDKGKEKDEALKREEPLSTFHLTY